MKRYQIYNKTQIFLSIVSQRNSNYPAQNKITVDCSKLLKLKYNILLRSHLFLGLKYSNSLSSFNILMSCLYYFKCSDKKNKTFDIGCIVKWGDKIDKVPFLSAKI